jgi:hypothetical protein
MDLADPKMVEDFPNQMLNYNWRFFDMSCQHPILGEYDYAVPT